ncbi:MAG: peptidylprolyl isomerase [Planctomycetota bacterium]|nr:peptidylprolyl isomerase [Planctomycetota bacterium]
MHSLLLLCLLIPLSTSADEEVVVQMDNQAIEAAAYRSWLYDRLGPQNAFQFMMEQAVLAVAREKDLLPSQEEVQATLEKETTDHTARMYGGDRSAFINALENRGYNLASWNRARGSQLYAEMTTHRLALAARVVTDDDIGRHFQQRFGEMAERVRIEVLFFDMYGDITEQPDEDVTALRQKSHLRASTALEIIEKTGAIAELAPTGDPISSEFVRDGYRLDYRRNVLGPEVERAVNSLDNKGDLSSLIEVWNGYYIVRLEGRTSVTIDEVRDELRAELETAPPTSAEMGKVERDAVQTTNAQLIMR